MIPKDVWNRQECVWSAHVPSCTVQMQDEKLTANPDGLDVPVWQGYAYTDPVYPTDIDSEGHGSYGNTQHKNNDRIFVW